VHYHALFAINAFLEPTMTATLTVESTLTDRCALLLGKHDKIRFSLQPNGEVVLTRANNAEVDPVLEPFLDFLTKDIAEHPQHAHALSTGLVSMCNR
jgi:antitoxin PrlF